MSWECISSEEHCCSLTGLFNVPRVPPLCVYKEQWGIGAWVVRVMVNVRGWCRAVDVRNPELWLFIENAELEMAGFPTGHSIVAAPALAQMGLHMAY